MLKPQAHAWGSLNQLLLSSLLSVPFPNPVVLFLVGLHLQIPYLMCGYLPFYSHFLSGTVNAERTWAVPSDRCSSQHSKPYLMSVLDEEEPLKFKADIANAYLIDGY